MPEHRVKFNVPFRDLGRSDVKFKVYAHERKQRRLLGTLLVSHGAVEWRGRKKHHKVRLDWPEFDRVIQAYGRESREFLKLAPKED